MLQYTVSRAYMDEKDTPKKKKKRVYIIEKKSGFLENVIMFFIAVITIGIMRGLTGWSDDD